MAGNDSALTSRLRTFAPRRCICFQRRTTRRTKRPFGECLAMIEAMPSRLLFGFASKWRRLDQSRRWLVRR